MSISSYVLEKGQELWALSGLMKSTSINWHMKIPKNIFRGWWRGYSDLQVCLCAREQIRLLDGCYTSGKNEFVSLMSSLQFVFENFWSKGFSLTVRSSVVKPQLPSYFVFWFDDFERLWWSKPTARHGDISYRIIFVSTMPVRVSMTQQSGSNCRSWTLLRLLNRFSVRNLALQEELAAEWRAGQREGGGGVIRIENDRGPTFQASVSRSFSCDNPDCDVSRDSVGDQ